MLQIKGIAGYIVERLVNRTNELSQGRNAGAIGFINSDGYISQITEIIDGGLSGLPFRRLLGQITDMRNKALLEGLMQLPDNTVFVLTRPGRTGLITDVSGVDFFNRPIVAIGVKEGVKAGVGIIYPNPRHFDLATETEKIDLEILAAKSMAEEKEIIRRSNDLGEKYLELSQELPVVDLHPLPAWQGQAYDTGWKLPRLQVSSIDKELAESLVVKSMEVGQGREVAIVGIIDDQGRVSGMGKIVAGGMGYVPSRVLASSAVDISGRSLRDIYAQEVPENAVVVHTHPGGTGVMHIGDANAVPGTWGRPIIAIGHDKNGTIRGATVIELSDKLYALADEDEKLNLEFFQAETPEQETAVRNRKFEIAQEYTDLCKQIEIN